MPVSAFSFVPLDVPTAAQANRMAEATQPWATYTPTITNVTTSGETFRYLRHGDLVTVQWQFTLTAAPTANVSISLPVNASTDMAFAATAARGVAVGLRAGSSNTGTIYLATTSTFRIITHGSGGAIWANGAPVAWANTDTWGGSFTYEAA